MATSPVSGPTSVDTAGTGALTAPAVPASTVALPNPFTRACLVSLFGGTVSVVKVGAATLTAVSGVVVVPAASSITLTYAVAPTWTWYGLL